MDDALDVAEKINKKSLISILSAKDCINKAYEMGLKQGCDYEKRVFWSTFATEDRKEGMKAFVEKRKPKFKDN